MSLNYTCMNKNLSSRLLLPFLLACFALAAATTGEAASRPFKAPAGTQVTSQVNKDYAVWTVTAPGGSLAVIARIKLPKQYWNRKTFQRYVNSYYKNGNDQVFAAYGVKLKLRWKNGAYTLSGTSGGYRVYGQGCLGKRGEWLYGSSVGQPSSRYTAALERMVKGLK